MSASIAAPHREPQKLFYIDNIKVILTILVVLHHTFIAYGASGGWYYAQKTTRVGALVPMTMFVSINQSFFMGFFFMLAAYFTYSSYNRKGAGKFIADRALRLGLPLLFYSFVFSPILCYLVYYFGKGHHISLGQYLLNFDDWIDFGVLWFVAALLLFTMIYVSYRKVSLNGLKKQLPVPAPYQIWLFAVVVGGISFLVRVVFPVGWVLKPFGFQLGHFSQYISLFIIGIVAAKNNWFSQLPYQTGRRMRGAALLALLCFPVFYLIKTKLGMPVEWFSGGFHWQALLYAVWEQFIGISIIVALLATGKHRWNSTSPLLGRLSRSAFAVYIFHPLIVIALSLLLKNWQTDPAVKMLLAAPLAVIGSFAFGSLGLIIPPVRRVI